MVEQEKLKAPHQRLKWAREQRYETAKAAAEALSLPGSTYAGHENGSRGFGKDDAERYGARFGVPWEWLLGGGPLKAGAGPTEAVRPPVQQILADDRTPGQIEVWASAEGGEQGAMLITTGPIDRIPRPAGLPIRGSFAVYLIGDSMSPAYDHGDQLYVNTNKPVRAGLDCLFVQELEDGTLLALAKRLIRPTADKWRVQQFNPPKEFDLDRRKWTKAWMVAGKMNRS